MTEFKEGSTNSDILDTPVESVPAPKPTETSALPDEFKDKSTEELAKMLLDSRKTIGRQGQELGKLRGDLEHLERSARFSPTPPTNEPTPAPEDSDPLSDMDDEQFVKVGAVKQLIQDVQRKTTTHIESSTVQKLRDAAQYTHQEMAPRFADQPLFKGTAEDGSDNIMEQVGQIIHDTFRPAVEKGHDVTTWMRSPETWIKAAKYARFLRGEYEYLTKEETPPPRSTDGPMPPFTGEIPGGRPREIPTEITLDAKGQFIKNKFGLTDDEIQEGLRQERLRRQGY